MDLDSNEWEGMELGYAEFMEFAEADYSGHLDPENFGSGFEIKADGIYVKKPPEGIDLTPKELAAITRHPRGRINEPALGFPFAPRELKAFFDWAARVGHDIPIDEDALEQLIIAQRTQPTLTTAGLAPKVSESDAALGAYVRLRQQAFSERVHEDRDVRAVEHQRWRDAGEEIKQGRQNPVSLRQLAELVKECLDLPDKVETIRKRLAEPQSGG
jgi:hypothetical protein